MAAPPFEVGQLVELVNQPPNYGRSLDGTLARVTWVPSVWTDDGIAHAVIVEYYRRHRRTGKPLAVKTSLMSAMQLKPITELTPEQADLLADVEPLRQEQISRRERMKADRIAWEQGILAMENQNENTTTRAASLAEEGLAELEHALVQHPPEGVSAAEIADFFERQRPTLLEALASLLRRSNGIEASEAMIAELTEHLEQGSPFSLRVVAAGEHFLFAIIPDVDGVFVMDQIPVEEKLTSEDAGSLLADLPKFWPAVRGGQLLAVEADQGHD